MNQTVVILDFGSQYTQLIARRIRSLNVYCVIFPCIIDVKTIKEINPQGIILSGGPRSVYEKGVQSIDKNILKMGIPILGICYGMQWITHVLSGKIGESTRHEYGQTKIDLIQDSLLWYNFSNRLSSLNVWMSHGDHIVKLPDGFEITSRSNDSITSIEDTKNKIYALQFHPEVYHTEYGIDILKSFLLLICSINPQWKMPNLLNKMIDEIKNLIQEKKVVLGLSGGVDSSVLAVLLHKAIGDNLSCVFVDNGLLRQNEREEVESFFKGKLNINFQTIDAKEIFLKNLLNISDPEQKRSIIGKTFIDVFYKKLPQFDFLAQGTLYPDIIESGSITSIYNNDSKAQSKISDTIKTHHNRVPEVESLIKEGKVIEPFKELFKDEVREIGKLLELPKAIIHRQPFPGPGLAVRILGEITQDKLSIVKKSDQILREEIENSQYKKYLWQYFTVLLPIRSVGVVGDKRAYGYVVAIRTVESEDAMTAKVSFLDPDLLTQIVSRVTGEIKEVSRVVLDVTSKPPGTIEWE